jgi:hypothetical protein
LLPIVLVLYLNFSPKFFAVRLQVEVCLTVLPVEMEMTPVVKKNLKDHILTHSKVGRYFVSKTKFFDSIFLLSFNSVPTNFAKRVEGRKGKLGFPIRTFEN